MKSVRRTAAAQELYDRVAQDSADLVIRAYSSSFGMASQLLSRPVRVPVRNVYALVRIADEIVDNPDAGLDSRQRAQALQALQEDVHRSSTTGYSANPVVHAFAGTARSYGIDATLTDPFFASMARDLDPAPHTADSIARYIHGSAEVVGLMCLRIFVAHDRDGTSCYEELAPGARSLGAAFQKVNFLRDLAEDTDTLQRGYFPGIDPSDFTDFDRDRILNDIESDLVTAQEAISRLPSSSRPAVQAAHDMFAELAARLRTTPADRIRRERVRVPGRVKLRIAANALRKERR